MSYAYKVLKDSPIGFWKLDETSGSVAADSSGCGNDGSYVGTFSLRDSIMPLIMGGSYGTLINSSCSISLPITKNFYSSTISGGGFGNLKTSDNDFSLEAWIYPSISSSNRTTILADETNTIGIYYENNNILFKINSEELYYNLNSKNKTFHVVASYTQTSMNIFVDGVMVASKSLLSFKFSNTSTGPFKIGPTLSANDYFIVDAAAIYRYALNNSKVFSHYSLGLYHINASQIVSRDGGFFFPCNEENLRLSYVYEYGVDKIKRSLTSETFYDDVNGYIGFYKSTGAKSLTTYDSIIMPSTLELVSSKIEWKGDKNVTVEMGTDGITYPYLLTNGSYLPLYNKEQSIGDRIIYLKITFSTSDSSKYFPKFSNLRVKFYSTKNLYSENSPYFITSDKDYDIASYNYPTLLRMKTDGIQTSPTGGFKINCDANISTIEFFYTPSALTASTLINSSNSNLSWDGSGGLSATNIASIYVNGALKSTSGNVSSLFSSNQMYHVVLRLTSATTGDIKFNYNISGGPSNKFNNIALYQKSLSAAEIARHYSDYTSRPLFSVSDTMALTDLGTNYASSEWTVISTS